MLRRELYRGVIVYNATRKRDQWGKKHQRPRPEAERIRVAAPDLAIVDDVLWTAAHQQIDRQRARYSRASRSGAPPWGIEPKYLLTGLLRCAECGGGMEIRSRSHGSRRVYFLGCASYQRRGLSVCRNGLTVPMDLADQAVLTAVERELLNPANLKIAVRCAVRRLSTPDDSQTRISDELARLDGELARLTAAVAQGGNLPALLSGIAVREEERQRLLQQRTLLPTSAVAHDERAILAELDTLIADWRSLLREDVRRARGLLKQLIVGRFVRLTAHALRRSGIGCHGNSGSWRVRPLRSSVSTLGSSAACSRGLKASSSTGTEWNAAATIRTRSCGSSLQE